MYRGALVMYFRWCLQRDLAPLDATRRDIEDYKQVLMNRDLKPASINSYLTVIEGFYNVAEQDDLVTKNPARFVKKPKKPRTSSTDALTYLEFADCLRASKALGPRHHALVVLLGMLGLRISEACSVQVQDFGEERGHRVLKIIGKGDKPAVIPLPPIVLRALEPLIQDREHGHLILSKWGTPLQRNSGHRLLKEVVREAKVDRGKNITPHSLRHTFVTQLLDGGTPLRDAQIAARHENPSMTIRYDRNRKVLDRHANYSLAGRMAGVIPDSPRR